MHSYVMYIMDYYPFCYVFNWWASVSLVASWWYVFGVMYVQMINDKIQWTSLLSFCMHEAWMIKQVDLMHMVNVCDISLEHCAWMVNNIINTLDKPFKFLGISLNCHLYGSWMIKLKGMYKIRTCVKPEMHVDLFTIMQSLPVIAECVCIGVYI